MIVLPSIGAGAVAAWALSKDAFSVAAEPLRVKEAVAGDFGLLLLLMGLVLILAGMLVNVGLTRGLPPLRVRRRIGIVALVIACVVPLAAFTSLAFSDRGLGGAIGDRVDQLTSETDTAPDQQGAGRLTAASSTRGKYWREAGRVFEDRPAIGLGAGNFQTTRLRHRSDASVTRHAHGFVPQTLADLGIVGVVGHDRAAVGLARAAARATGLYPRRLPFGRDDGAPAPRRDWDDDRIALVATALIAIVFGLQSVIDWTWFVPGPTAMALVAAGFVAGRAPFGLPAPPVAASSTRADRARRGCWPRPGVLVAAVLLAWAIWQPEASDRATSDALRLADGRRGRCRARQDPGRRRREPAERRPAADPGRHPDRGRSRGRRARVARAGRAEVPRRPPDVVPAGGLPAGHARPPGRRRRHRAGRDLPRPALGAQPGAVPPGARPRSRAGRSGRR